MCLFALMVACQFFHSHVLMDAREKEEERERKTVRNRELERICLSRSVCERENEYNLGENTEIK